MTFLQDFKKWTYKVKHRSDNVMQETSNQLSKSVANLTGVSTGKALGSWTPSKSGSTQTYSGGQPAWKRGAEGWYKDEAIAAANRANALSHALPQIEAVTATLEITDDYYLLNGVSYIQQVEYEGWANTGPYRMVKRTTQEFEQTVAVAVQAAKMKYK